MSECTVNWIFYVIDKLVVCMLVIKTRIVSLYTFGPNGLLPKINPRLKQRRKS